MYVGCCVTATVGTPVEVEAIATGAETSKSRSAKAKAANRLIFIFTV